MFLIRMHDVFDFDHTCKRILNQSQPLHKEESRISTNIKELSTRVQIKLTFGSIHKRIKEARDEIFKYNLRLEAAKKIGGQVYLTP